MIAKKLETDEISGQSLRELAYERARYIVNPKDKSQNEKCVAVKTYNLDRCGFEEALNNKPASDAAAAELSKDFVATVRDYPHADKVKKPFSHWVLSWESTQKISHEQMFDDAEVFLTKLGYNLDKTQCLMGIHNDTDHHHLHIHINRISLDGKLCSEGHNRKFKDASQMAVAEITHARGYVPTPGATFRVNDQGKTVRQPKQRLDTVSGPSLDWEALKKNKGKQSDERILKGILSDILPTLSVGMGWQAYHDLLSEHGVVVKKAKGGLTYQLAGTDDKGKPRKVFAASKLDSSKVTEKALKPFLDRPEMESALAARYVKNENELRTALTDVYGLLHDGCGWSHLHELLHERGVLMDKHGGKNGELVFELADGQKFYANKIGPEFAYQKARMLTGTGFRQWRNPKPLVTMDRPKETTPSEIQTPAMEIAKADKAAAPKKPRRKYKKADFFDEVKKQVAKEASDEAKAAKAIAKRQKEAVLFVIKFQRTSNRLARHYNNNQHGYGYTDSNNDWKQKQKEAEEDFGLLTAAFLALFLLFFPVYVERKYVGVEPSDEEKLALANKAWREMQTAISNKSAKMLKNCYEDLLELFGLDEDDISGKDYDALLDEVKNLLKENFNSSEDIIFEILADRLEVQIDEADESEETNMRRDLFYGLHDSYGFDSYGLQDSEEKETVHLLNHDGNHDGIEKETICKNHIRDLKRLFPSAPNFKAGGMVATRLRVTDHTQDEAQEILVAGGFGEKTAKDAVAYAFGERGDAAYSKLLKNKKNIVNTENGGKKNAKKESIRKHIASSSATSGTERANESHYVDRADIEGKQYGK